MSIAVFLMAAGLGMRLRPLTNYIPKCLIPIFRKPVLEYWLEAIEKTDINDVYINTHWKPSCVQDYLNEYCSKSSLNITLLHEESLLGSAGTLLKNYELLINYDKVIIIYSDNYFVGDITDFIRQCCISDQNLIGVFKSSSPQNCGIFSYEAGKLNFEEKPDFPKSNIAWSGILSLSMSGLRNFKNKGDFNKNDLCDIAINLIPSLLTSSELREVGAELIDIGTFEGYSKALSCVLKGETDEKKV